MEPALLLPHLLLGLPVPFRVALRVDAGLGPARSAEGGMLGPKPAATVPLPAFVCHHVQKDPCEHIVGFLFMPAVRTAEVHHDGRAGHHCRHAAAATAAAAAAAAAATAVSDTDTTASTAWMRLVSWVHDAARDNRTRYSPALLLRRER